MKRFFLWILLALPLLAGGCVGDLITLVETEEETALEDPGLSWSSSSFEASLGGSNTFPTLSNDAGVSVSYASSDEEVATVAGDGTVTLVATGTTTITAESAATGTYEASSASYTLTVSKSTDGISWSTNSSTVTLGASDNEFPTLNNPGGQTIAYSSSNAAVATIDSNGAVTLLTAGATTITAVSTENENYASATASYSLTVQEEGSNLSSADLSWPATEYSATMGSDFTSPTLTNPHGLSVTYSSSETSVATVDESGNVTLTGAGTTAITASYAGDDTYAASSVSYTLKVNKGSVTLAWSETSCTVNLTDASASYPTLTASPDGLTLTYASSNTAVATVSASGSVSALAKGTATISVSFDGNDYYSAASASYSLSVVDGSDDGAVSTVFESAGDSSSDDDISNTSFTRLVTVSYASGGATVSGYSAVSDVFDVSVSGNQVTITYSGEENVVYKLTGTASDGFFKLYSSKKQALWLSGLSLTSTDGAAINNQSGKRTFVYVDGTNTLADGSSAGYSTSGDEDMKGVFFSEGQLIFSGSGSLAVTASNKESKSGIVSDDYVRIMDAPSITVTAGSNAGHGIRGKEYVQLSDGTLKVTTAAAMKKGIGSDGYVLVEGGSSTITVTGGVGYDSDDAEYKGSAGIKADNYFAMTGGTVSITNSGSGGKGVSAGSYDYYSENGSLSDSYISGGTLTVKTTGSESNDVSSKAVKIGFKQQSGSSYIYAGNMKISGGALTVNCSKSEGFEVKGDLTVSGGETYVYSTGDDAINCQGTITVTGGYVYGYSTANDGIDSNGDTKLSGGYVFAITTKGSPEVAFDTNTEGGYKLYINSGATLVAYGGLESGYSASQTVYSMSCTANAWNAPHNGSSYIAAFKAPSGISSVAVSAPSLSKGYTGVTVSDSLCNGTWASGDISGGSSVSLSSYSGGGGQGGQAGPGNGGGGPGGH